VLRRGFRPSAGILLAGNFPGFAGNFDRFSMTTSYQLMKRSAKESVRTGSYYERHSIVILTEIRYQ
jgi:hypothetical protein